MLTDALSLLLVLISTIITVGLFVYGISRFIGLGWAMFLFDFFSHSGGGGYVHLQKTSPPANTARGRIFGILCILSGFASTYITVQLTSNLLK